MRTACCFNRYRDHTEWAVFRRRYRRRSFLFPLEGVDALDEKEYSKSDDDKRNDGVDKHPNVHRHRTGRLGTGKGCIGPGSLASFFKEEK